VLLNLLDNAVKYGPPGQTVTLGVDVHGRAPDARARLWVEDEGQGIPAESRARVFEPYVRLPRHQGAAHGGSGIGLSVVRELAELHGGEAWVERAASGGARFVVVLPLAPAGAPPRPQHAPEAPADQHPRRADRTTSVQAGTGDTSDASAAAATDEDVPDTDAAGTDAADARPARRAHPVPGASA
jgi:hypothetical protein